MFVRQWSVEARYVIKDFARKGLKGHKGAPLPDGLSRETFDEINNHQIAFRLAVRLERNKLSK